MFTGTIGTLQSKPGNLQPGYFCTGIAVWRGPFDPARINAGGSTPTTVARLAAASVPVAVASQMAASDPDWWEFH